MAAPTTAKAVRTAKALLSKYSVTEAPVDVRHIAEKEGIIFESVDLEDDVPGFLILGKETYLTLNENHPSVRQRFTIAHSLGHYLMPRVADEIFIYDLLLYARGAGTRATSAPDAVANVFAAALLMPAEILKRELTGRRIDVYDDVAMRVLAQRYQVSVAALAIRLAELRMVRGS